MERLFCMKHILAILCILFSFGLLKSQKVPEGYFRSPVDLPLFLSANFGELRTNHFHSGIDIKVGGKEGERIYAIADGYVSRIRISPWGFGKALYIDHPNGYTSVYGHLRNFSDSLDTYSDNIQYQIKSFAIDTILKPGIFVKKGMLIGYAGNSGSSFGAHLHFEIRQTDTEKPQNPELFGFKIKDNTKPKAYEIYLYPLKSVSRINNSTEREKIELSGNEGKYNIGTQTVSASGLIGIGINANDFYDNSNNKCGIYKIKLFSDDTEIYSFTLDEFSFSETRYINSHLDFELNITEKDKIHRLFIEPGNKLSIYENPKNDGHIFINEVGIKKIKIVLEDVKGNKSTVSFDLQTKKTSTKYSIPECAYIIPYDSAYYIEDNNIKLSFHKETLYDTLFMNYSSIQNPKYLSPLYSIHDLFTPLQRPIEISIKPDSFPESIKAKLLIISFNNKGGMFSLGGEFREEWLFTKSLSLGEFAVYYDTIPPKIKPINIFEGAKFVNDKKIEFKITDNLSGIQSYNGHIDEKWVKFEYDPKKAKILYNFDGKIERNGKKHQLKLIVCDERENSSEYEVSFYY